MLVAPKRIVGLTVQVAIGHLEGQVPNKQSLAGRVWCSRRGIKDTGGRAGPLPVPSLMRLYHHPSALKHALVHLLDSFLRIGWRLKLQISKSLAQTARVGDDACIGDVAELGKVRLQAVCGDFEEQIADVEDAGVGYASSSSRGKAHSAVSWGSRSR